MKYEIYFNSFLRAVDQRLEEVLPPKAQNPSVIHEAMRYAIFPGGKRFRAVLTLAACEAAGGKWEEGLIPAVSIELVHNYSLVHDDLPSLDNDEMRRGKLTVHRYYSEAIAILVGDGLLTLAFQNLSGLRSAEKARDLMTEISTAAGTYGMIGGQVADLTVRNEDLSLPMLDYINIHKTGKLIKASAVSGAIAAGASKTVRAKILKYGELIGLAFQSIDDLSDGDGYLRLMKTGEIRNKTRDLIAAAKREIRSLGKKGEKLHKLADDLLRRLPRGSDAKVAH